MKNKHEIDLCEGKLVPKLIVYALPLMLSGILQLAFNAADLIVVGRYTGEAALAAVGSNGSLVSLIVNVLLGFGTGTSVLAARYFGAKHAEQMRETVETTVIVGVLGGILFGLAGILLSAPLLRMMGTPEEVLPLAIVYLRIYFAGLPLLSLYNFSSAVLRAVGDTKRPLYYMAIAGVLNVGLNLFLVIVFELGVVGVAVATDTSTAVACILTLRCLRKSDGIYRLPKGLPHFNKTQFVQMLRIGLPAGIQSSLFSVSNVIIQSSINSFGAAAVAGNAAATSLEGFCFCCQDAIAQSATACVSQNMGARKYSRTKTTVFSCIVMEIVVSVVMCGLLMLFREPLLGIYTDDADAIAAGCIRITVVGLTFFFGGLMNMMTGAIRGHGYSILPTSITLIGVCGFRLVWIYTIFKTAPSLRLLFISYPISWMLTFIAQIIAYLSIRQKAFDKNEAQYHPEFTIQNA